MNKPPMNMNNEHDWLDKILSGPDGYIHDDGFTERVLGRLPAPRRNRRLNGLILGCAGLLSAAFLLLSAPGLVSLYAHGLELLRTQPLYTLTVLVIGFYTMMSVVAYWFASPGRL
jgi:hypothetical protein